jgi:hypothetical protein
VSLLKRPNDRRPSKKENENSVEDSKWEVNILHYIYGEIEKRKKKKLLGLKWPTGK